MAGEQESQAAASAQTGVSSPLSSQAQSQSTSGSAEGSGGASTETQSSQAGTTGQQAETAATRPEGIPDSYWDAEAKALKVDPAALAKDLKERDELKTFKAAEDIKAQTRPKTAEEYKIELPADYKFPVGAEFTFDKADPLLARARETALAKGLSQADFSDFLGLYAAAKSAEKVGKEAFKTDQIKALGPNAGARVDAIVNWYTGMDTSADKGDAKALAAGLQTARQVEAMERFITRLTTQGSASFSQSHRVPADEKSIPGFDKMSFAQKRFAQDQAAARRTG